MLRVRSAAPARVLICSIAVLRSMNDAGNDVGNDSGDDIFDDIRKILREIFVQFERAGREGQVLF
jgi:hypothetical protein